MLAVRTPGAPQSTRSVAQPAVPPSPLSDRVGYSDHVRFRGYFPVHFIPAYNLPVYASQWPLPDTTQDSVRGCSLGFTAAAISGGRVQRTCTAQRPAVGSRTGAPTGLSTVPRFQSPPRRTQRADFPHCALPFASLQGLWDLPGWSNFRSVASHSIAVEQPESVVQP